MFATLSNSQDWEAAGHSLRTSWIEFTGRYGASGLVALALVFVVIALVRRHRYRAVNVLNQVDLKRLQGAIAEAEKKTVGEILPVIVERSDAHPQAAWIAGLFSFLFGSALLAAWLPWDQPVALLASQLAMGLVGYLLARVLPDFQRRFIGEARATEMATEQAFQEFYVHKLHETEAKTGVLLFVSLLEHRVIVLGDAGIDEKVDPNHWVETTDAILDGIRRGSLCEGLSEGVARAGEVLAEYFPWAEGDRNEIPDRIIVRKQ
ncbi:MAG: hypothetical protein CMJ89_05510 [Planctomycetes bacterium]|jgi:putative membrane protein|nr:hypothetical protein [Planctomycetota bacterium]